MAAYFKLLFVKENSDVYSYASVSGLTGGLTAVLLYQLALLSVPREEDESE